MFTSLYNGLKTLVKNTVKKFCCKQNIFSMKKQFEEIMVTHRESRDNSRRKHTLNKILYYIGHCFKMYVFKQFIQIATYKVLTLRRKNADPNKGVAFR